ncbi:hypothetical protein LLG96_02015 [bacterium]|nr:hypothetical protein [bacterium]
MNLASIKKFFTGTGAVITGIIGAGAGLALFYTLRKTRKRGITKKTAIPEPVKTMLRSPTKNEKNDALTAVFSHIQSINEGSFTIRFGQSTKKGYRGYYLQNAKKHTVFFCWADEFEAAHGQTPYWIELDESATRAFKRKGMKKLHDIYPHPSSGKRILIAVNPEEMNDPGTVAEKVIHIARDTLS